MTSRVQSLPVLTPVFGTAAASTILGAIHYGTRHLGPRDDDGHPELTVQMVTEEADPFTEFWHTKGKVERGRRDGVVYAHDGEHFFCAGHVEESRSYTDAVRSAYLIALDAAHSAGYDRMFRVWNYIHRINGRAEAFDRVGLSSGLLPAATGVGSLGGGIAFCFLANRSGRRVNIENARQIPAYRYPRRYGPRSPASPGRPVCSRRDIYVSGTASILGHHTVHPGRADRQCREALANIEHVIGSANLAAHGVTPGRHLTDLRNVKVYVRAREDIAMVREICAGALAPDCDVAYFNVDICRPDLLVEIEGVVAPPGRTSAASPEPHHDVAHETIPGAGEAE